MTCGAFGHDKHPSEPRMGGAKPAQELTESYVRWRCRPHDTVDALDDGAPIVQGAHDAVEGLAAIEAAAVRNHGGAVPSAAIVRPGRVVA